MTASTSTPTAWSARRTLPRPLPHGGPSRRVAATRPAVESIGRALKALAEPRIAIDRVEPAPDLRRYYAGIKLNDDGKKHWADAVTSASLQL